MPVITKRGKSFQAIVAYKGERHRRQFATEAEALAWGHETRARVMRGEPPETSGQAHRRGGRPYTLGELRDWCIETHWRKQKAAKTHQINADAVTEIIGASKPIHKIDGFEVGKLKAALDKKGNGNATINRKLASLSRMLTEAIRLEIIDRKPYIQRLKEAESRHFRVSRELEVKMIAYFERIGHPEMALLIPLGIDTGLRQGELLRLRWEDVDVGSLRIYETKGGRNRVVPLTARARQALDAAHVGHEAAELVFGGINVWSVTHYWGRMKEALGFDDEAAFVPHILRHEFCSRLADAGVNATSIMRLAGHSSLSVTQRYVNMAPVGLGSAIAAMEAAE